MCGTGARATARGHRSRGCPRCGRVLGDRFAFQRIDDARPVGRITVPLSLLARRATIEAVEDHRAWIVR